jgi:chromosomal replication initiator protein
MRGINITPKFITELVCSHYNVSALKLKSMSRKRELVDARHMAIYLMLTYTKLSQKSIGLLFGGRDHATIINSKKVTKNLIDTDRIIKGNYEILAGRLNDMIMM